MVSRTLTQYFPPLKNLVYAVPAILLCVALQIQLTFFKNADYLGIRLSAADLLLPFLGCLIIGRLFLRRDPWPRWQVPYTYLWLLGLTTLMSFALMNGYIHTGQWNPWALINKYAGWFVLLGYLGVGAWIAGQDRCNGKKIVADTFIGFWVITLIISLIYMIYIDLAGTSHQIYNLYPIEALMANRNAYAFLSFSALGFMTAHEMGKPKPASFIFYLVWALVPLFYIYNASRAGLIVLFFILLAYFIVNLKWSLRHILIPLLIGITLTIGYTLWHKDSLALAVTFKRVHQTAQLTMLSEMSAAEVHEKLDYDGDQVRLHTFQDALAVWQTHPVFGGGFGSFRKYQLENRGTYSDVIDFTALWLLAETGLVGLGAFVVFFALSLWRIFRRIRMKQDPDGFYLGVLMIMLVFAIMSLVHELLYTRFLWFFMGMALAVPAPERHS
ncbi:MAG: O-antigen ligase family protein [Alphaproteobacteria bacterium]|nr:O-antigen ligase family protein [Alphaproteobacteria bacterium]